MNGYSHSEDIALGVRGVATRCGMPHSGCADSPVFIFAAGRGAGAAELIAAIEPVYCFVNDLMLPPRVIDEFARQFIAVGFAEPSANAPSAAQTGRDLDLVIAAQIRYFRDLGGGAARRAGNGRWGVVQFDLPGEYAVYLRFLFPACRIVFLDRDPADAYRAFLAAQPAIRQTRNDVEFAASFGAHCADLATGFQRWHDEVASLLIDFERLAADELAELNEYLEVNLRADRHFLARESDDPIELSEKVVNAVRGETHESLNAGTIGDRAAHQLAAHRVVSAGRDECAILVPVARYVEPECEDALRSLEQRGYAVRRLYGCSAIDAARNTLVTRALDEGFGETFWIDADVAFEPDDVDRLRAHALPISSGIYAKKGFRELATGLLPGTAQVIFGSEGGLMEILYAGAGFLHVRRSVYETIRARLSLPVCSASSQRRAIPFFMPMIEQWGERFTYLAEDYGFCRRARQCGFKIYADTSIRLWHIGSYRYGYEDASAEIARVKTHHYRPPGA